MRKIKALIYAIIGGMMCWNTFNKGHVTVSLGIGFFTLAAIAITLAAIGTKKITWDGSGITITKFPSAPIHIPWSQLEKMRVDHLGYHIQSKRTKFKIRRKNMPDHLLEKLRASIRDNKA